MNKPALILKSFCTLFSFLVVSFGCSQLGTKTDDSLFGENLGDQIVLDWDLHGGTAEYVVYKSGSAGGPWQEAARIREVAAKTGGAKVDVTPDARLKDICYKVEALDTEQTVIRRYRPICVPKYVDK